MGASLTDRLAKSQRPESGRRRRQRPGRVSALEARARRASARSDERHVTAQRRDEEGQAGAREVLARLAEDRLQLAVIGRFSALPVRVCGVPDGLRIFAPIALDGTMPPGNVGSLPLAT